MKLLLAALTALVTLPALAWIDTGHMVVAEIALRDLKPEVRQKAEELLKIGGDERSKDFLGAACWADDFKTPENGPWHYINIHFRTDGKPTKMQALPQNVVWAINKFSPVLQDTTLSVESRAEALRFLEHFVGDIHQPMHAVARDTDATPEGDRGGNDFKFEPFQLAGFEVKNMHFLWDIAGGLYGKTTRPLTDKAPISKLADEIIAANPRSSFPEESVTDPMAWAKESEALAHELVYNTPEGTKPSDSYLEAARKACGKRLALAGYRLADLLNKLLG